MSGADEGRNYVVAVKEHGAGRTSLQFELHEDIGMGDATFAVDLDSGTSIRDAAELARTINRLGSRVRLHCP